MKNFDYESYKKWREENIVVDKSIITHRDINLDRLRYKLIFNVGEGDPKSVKLKYEGYLWKEALPLMHKKLHGWCDKTKPYAVLNIYDNKRYWNSEHTYIYTNDFIGLMSGLCYDGHNLTFVSFEKIIDGKVHILDKYSTAENGDTVSAIGGCEFNPDDYDGDDDEDVEVEFEIN